MNQIWKNILFIGLALLALVLGTFGGCYVLGTAGDNIDRANGTFGKGLEGSANGIMGMLFGTVLGFLVTAIFIFVVWKKWGKRR